MPDAPYPIAAASVLGHRSTRGNATTLIFGVDVPALLYTIADGASFALARAVAPQGARARRDPRASGADVLAAPFNVMAKPAGAACNLACTYCFYRDRDDGAVPRMSDAALEAFVRGMFAAHAGQPIVRFDWQGGEPTLCGLAFFERAVALQRRFARPGQTVENALQTNGLLLDDAWGAFLARHGFLVGLSVDGPRAIHDAGRVDRGGAPSFDRVMRTVALLRRHGAEFNVLAVVTAESAREPAAVYGFLRELTPYLQLIPCVDRVGASGDRPLLEPHATGGSLAPWSVTPEAWGAFLCAVFDAWVVADVGRVYVQMFDALLGLTLGLPSGLCTLDATCGTGLAIEADGGLYPCDHYVFPRYRLGDLDVDVDAGGRSASALERIARSEAMQAFGRAKRETLTRQCRACPELRRCGGGCPKHRFAETADGEPGLDALCEGWRAFLAHAGPAFDTMAGYLQRGEPPARIMER